MSKPPFAEPCPYPQHRGEKDWLRNGVATVCGICHPKPPGKDKAPGKVPGGSSGQQSPR